MVIETQVTKNVNLDVEKSATVSDDRFGDQWELTARGLFGSKFPVPIKFPIDEGFPLPRPGIYYRTVLRREKLKSGKDGSRDWDYFWGGLTLGSLTPPGDGSETPSEAPKRPAQPRQASLHPDGHDGPYRDPTRASIERQVALKEARAATEYLLQANWGGRAQDQGPEFYLALAKQMYDGFLALLQGLEIIPSVTEPEDSQQVPETKDTESPFPWESDEPEPVEESQPLTREQLGQHLLDLRSKRGWNQGEYVVWAMEAFGVHPAKFTDAQAKEALGMLSRIIRTRTEAGIGTG